MVAIGPGEVVRRVFGARAAGDVSAMLALMDPAIEAETVLGVRIVGIEAMSRYLTRDQTDNPCVEADAFRIDECDDGVVVHGRIRVIEGGHLADSPAAWHFTVRDGRICAIAVLPVGRSLQVA